jgi:glycosyltransferase involved in cell wall biosynthesis
LAPEDLARVYASVDVVAHPSEIEERSNVALEALASGRPLLLAEAVARGILADGETGIVVPGGTVAAWAQKLAVVSESAELRARLGAAARRRAEIALPTWRDVLEEDLLSVWRRARVEASP